MIQAYIALGSNLQDPTKQVQTALAELDQIEETRLIMYSSLYHNPPVGMLDQPDFINAVALVETNLTAENLLSELLNLEQKHQRVRKERNGPRTLDLDLLLYGNQTIKSDFLTVPHPALKERYFVVYPLAEISPGLILPCGVAVQTLCEKLGPVDNSTMSAIKT